MEAIVTQVAAALRTLTADGVNLTEPYGDDVPAPSANGIVLVPWPNRVEDGSWLLDGAPQQLDITEPRFHNASQGLLRWTAYTLVEHGQSVVELAATVHPQHGYPFQLDTRVRYELVERGITVTHTILNVGTARAPVAIGAHPFLRVGDVPTEQLVITVAASSRFSATERKIPFMQSSLDGEEADLRGGRPLALLRLDDTYGDVEHVEGRAVHSVQAADGSRVELWQDESFGYVQVFTLPNYPRDGRPDLAVAIEPMTAPPNALASKRSLKWLAPDETWVARWGIGYEPGRS
jgi:aldose 1-epimerase